jgi:mono/diheme cytochrome c family protein
MKKLFRILGYTVLVILLLVAGLLIYLKTALPNVGDAPLLHIELTAQRIERGKYLANNVTACVDCHSTRDKTKFSGPLVPGTLGKGGERFDQKYGFPGIFYSKNITPSGIGRYTDGELFRVITTGVNKEGRAMFPVMPYHYYGQMDPEDIRCIIAYLRTLPSIENEVPASAADFPMNFILNSIPQKADPHPLPAPSDTLAYGAYMTTASGCIECHTPVKRGQIIPALAYSGGREFVFPDGSLVRSANITPDKATGIGNWTQEQFISRFALYADSNYTLPQTVPGGFNTIMPWTQYARMKKEDLATIYAYLRHVQPVQNPVEKFSPPDQK